MALVGKWEYVSADNMDGYMEAAGFPATLLYYLSCLAFPATLMYYISCLGSPAVPENLREVARKSIPTLEISNDGDSWTIKTTVSDKVKDTTFKVGEEFDSVSLTGQALKCTVAMEGEKMVETQKAGDATVIVTREKVGDQLISKMTIGGQTATITFKKA